MDIRTLVNIYLDNTNALIIEKSGGRYEIQTPEDSYIYDDFISMMTDIYYTINVWIEEGYING